MPIDYFNDLKYIGTEIVLGSFGKFQLLIADAHVLPDAKRYRRDSNATSLVLHPTP